MFPALLRSAAPKFFGENSAELRMVPSDMKTSLSTKAASIHWKLLLLFSLLQLLRSSLLPQIFAVTKTQQKHMLWNPSAVLSHNRALRAQGKARWVCRVVCFYFSLVLVVLLFSTQSVKKSISFLWIYKSRSWTNTFLFQLRPKVAPGPDLNLTSLPQWTVLYTVPIMNLSHQLLILRQTYCFLPGVRQGFRGPS